MTGWLARVKHYWTL